MNKNVFLQHQLKSIADREALLKEMIEQLQSTEILAKSIMNEINALYSEKSIMLIKSKHTPEKVSLFGCDFVLRKYDRTSDYLHFGKDFFIIIQYRNKENNYSIEIEPDFKSGDIYSHNDLFNHRFYEYNFAFEKTKKIQ